MTRQNISIGTTANDGTGDTLRSAGQKINQNFVEIYQRLGGDSDTLSTGITLTNNTIVFEGTTADNFETVLQVANPTKDNIITFPDSTGEVILTNSIQTLINKTLVDPDIRHADFFDSAGGATGSYSLIFDPAQSSNVSIRFPVISVNDYILSRTSTDILTNKTLTSPAITTPRITTGINDTNGAELIRFTATASAVNDIAITNAATGNKPTITATGDDTNITVRLAGKGTGAVEIAKAAYTSATISSAGAASTSATYIICNSGSALAVSLANGTVVGETKIFTNRGAGVATVTPATFAQGTSFALAQWDGCQVIWDGNSWYLIGNQSQVTVA